jgi:hypothetical protein
VKPTHLAIPDKASGLKRCRFIVTPPVAAVLVDKIEVGLTKNQLRHCLDNICKNAGIVGVTPHTLRKTFASVGGDLGEQDDMVNALLGHSGGRITDTYVMRSIHALSPVAARIADHIAALLGHGDTKPTAKAKLVLAKQAKPTLNATITVTTCDPPRPF